MAKFMEFVNCYLDAWRKYISFSGRATRKDYWGFVLINILVSLVLSLAELIVGIDDHFLSSLYSLAVICPDITLTTRRLHDVNRSGWWQLAVIVPLLNIYLAYLVWIKAGKSDTNKFGEPAAVASESAYSLPVANEFSGYEMCPAPTAESASCASCGATLKPGAKFCEECGTPTNK